MSQLMLPLVFLLYLLKLLQFYTTNYKRAVYRLTESNAALTCCAHDSAFCGGVIMRAVVLNSG